MPKPTPTPIITSVNEPSPEVLRRCWRVLLEGEERAEGQPAGTDETERLADAAYEARPA